MSLHNSTWSSMLKGPFFDLMNSEDGNLQYEPFIHKLLEALESVLEARVVTLFVYDSGKQMLIAEASTESAEKGIRFAANGLPDDAGTVSPSPGLDGYTWFLPLKKGRRHTGLIAAGGLRAGGLNGSDADELAAECSMLLHTAWKLRDTVREQNRFRQLFRVTAKFHSSMNMADVLTGMIDTLKDVYSDFTYFLFLSHDNTGYEGLPIKSLDYDSEDLPAMQAYQTGTIQFENSIHSREALLYAPLKGKQGVYGVLQVIAEQSVPQDAAEFISLLAQSAGGALENAQLYQQSKRLVADLQLINETSHKLNSNLRLSETIAYMREQILRSFHAEEIGFITLSHEGAKVLSESTSFFRLEDSAPYIEYLTEKIVRGKEPVYMGDVSQHERFASLPFRSMMAVPMIQSDSLKGYAVVLHSVQYFFSFEMFKLLQSLIHHSTLAFANAMLREELEKMVITDSLTKLYSRNFLDEKLAESFESDENGTFILMDIDNFKRVNDTYGHQVGDEVLVQVAGLIVKNIRGTDIGARWGGEELAIYLPSVSLSVGISIAKRLLERVKSTSTPSITISCGISHWNKIRTDSAKALFKRADEALYHAKNSGKNKLIVHEDDIILLP
ncbi:diguanylate cyclase domain-containing protein [Peribacillus sp. SCS-37]|uniref:sensor domain-containing diguanylate cyclase n=1 Tax=Paraperibacillus esterisolvens TaxID=3115296 RepID=UPI0039062A8D